MEQWYCAERKEGRKEDFFLLVWLCGMIEIVKKTIAILILINLK